MQPVRLFLLEFLFELFSCASKCFSAYCYVLAVYNPRNISIHQDNKLKTVKLIRSILFKWIDQQPVGFRSLIFNLGVLTFLYYNCSNLQLSSTVLTPYIFCLRLVLAFCSHVHIFSHWATTTSSLRGPIPPVFHFKTRSSIKCLFQWYNKQTCQLVFHTVPLIAERQAGKLVDTNFKVFGLPQPGPKLGCIATEADCLPTQPSKISEYAEVQQYL